MDIGIVGTGPAVDAISSAMGDVDATVTEVDVDELSEMSFGFLVGAAGADAFSTAAETLDRWVAVEVGGVGGYAVEDVDASVSVFTSDSGCFRCLRQRTGATVEPAEKPQGVRSAVRYAGAVAARRAIRLLSGEKLGGTIVEIEGPERRFQPVPFCRCGDGRDRTLTLSHREVDLEDAIARGEQAVDDRVGIVRQIGEQESYPLPYYLAQTADTSGFSDTRAAEFAAGADTDWNAAYMKALGEAMERYSAGVYRDSEFRQATAAELEGAVLPDRFVQPDEYPTPEATEERSWVPALDVAEGSPAWLPAEVVQYPPPSERIKPAITTGLGLGNSTIEATLSGLYEVLERDATMLSWYSTFEPLGLDIDDDGFDELRRRALSEGLEVSASLLTQDVDVPVVAVAVHRENEWPKFATGSGCALDPVDAAESALAEALQNWIELRNMGPEQAREEGGAIGEYGEFPDRARELTEFDVRVPAERIADEAAEFSGEAELSALVERVTAAGLESYAARITPQDVESLGFEAVRATIPEAQPLFTGEPFFGDRLDSIAASMGFEPKPDRAYHPFP